MERRSGIDHTKKKHFSLKTRFVAFMMAMIVFGGVFAPGNTVFAAKKHICTFSNANTSSNQYLILYDKTGKPYFADRIMLKGTKGAKYWENPAKYFKTEDLGNHFTKEYIQKRARDTVNKSTSFKATKLTKDYKKNGVNYKGYYVIPFRVYGNLTKTCPRCKKKTITKEAIVYKGYIMYKPATKTKPAVTDCILLSSKSLSIKDAAKIKNATSNDTAIEELIKVIKKAKWKPF